MPKLKNQFGKYSMEGGVSKGYGKGKGKAKKKKASIKVVPGGLGRYGGFWGAEGGIKGKGAKKGAYGGGFYTPSGGKKKKR